MVMVFNATFNNISVMLWWSVLFVEETGVPRGIDHLESILIVSSACGLSIAYFSVCTCS